MTSLTGGPRVVLSCLPSLSRTHDSLSSNGQVCAYRCITSYETATMEAFSLCVLQRNNCMCNSAEIPLLPDPAPLASFRGVPLTHKVAEDLFIGWLSKEPFSWKVVSACKCNRTDWLGPIALGHGVRAGLTIVGVCR